MCLFWLGQVFSNGCTFKTNKSTEFSFNLVGFNFFLQFCTVHNNSFRGKGANRWWVTRWMVMSLLIISDTVTKIQDEVLYSSKRLIFRNRKSVSSSDTSLYTIPLINMLIFFNSFPHLGIQCAKKKDVENNLKQRKEINVDPFQSKQYLQGQKWLCMYNKISGLLNPEGNT